MKGTECDHMCCAMCIVKLVFSKLHVPTGSWLYPLKCPTCSSIMLYIDPLPGRDDESFPLKVASTMDAIVAYTLGSARDATIDDYVQWRARRE